MPKELLKDQDGVATIRKYGDILEQHMFSDENFAKSFYFYTLIWMTHVLPTRKADNAAPSLPQFVELAERHYTAIVRCWNMRNERDHITEACDHLMQNPTDAKCLTDLNNYLFSFFCNAGAAIDNLEAAFSVSPLGLLNGETNKIVRGNGDGWGTLEWFYDRRTQFIHNILLPLYPYEGVTCLDSSMLLGKSPHWNQSPEYVPANCVQTLVQKAWATFEEQIGTVWKRLWELLKAKITPEFSSFSTMDICVYSGDWVTASGGKPYGFPAVAPPPSGFESRAWRERIRFVSPNSC